MCQKSGLRKPGLDTHYLFNQEDWVMKIPPEEATIAAALAETMREADTVYEKGLLFRLVCRMPLREGLKEIADAWRDLQVPMSHNSSCDNSMFFDIITQKEQRAVEDRKAQIRHKLEEMLR